MSSLAKASLFNFNYLRHLLSNYFPITPHISNSLPTATIYHSIYDQSIPINQSFAMTLTPAIPEGYTLEPGREHQPQEQMSSQTTSAKASEPLNQDRCLDWDVPAAPAAPKHGFLSFLPVFVSSTSSRPKANFAQEDTEYHAPSKEGGTLRSSEDVGGAAMGEGLATSGGARNGTGSRFNIMPSNRRYLGLSRKMFLLVLGVVGLCLLGLIIGLAVGLSKKHSSSALPLPSNTAKFTGDITYYDPGGPGYGACGDISYSTDPICAVSYIVFDAASTSTNPNTNPLCGKMIRITRFDSSTGKNNTVDVKVVDRCTGCDAADLDLSESSFADLASLALGRVTATWAWL